MAAGTFAGQPALPRLPIPPLEATLARYLKAVAPLLSAHQLEQTQAAVASFGAAEGPALQARLERYAEGKASYIEEFWFEAYLTHEDSVVLNLNPYFVLEDDPTPSNNDQVTRAASLVIGAVQFHAAIVREDLVPDDWRGTALCMEQYRKLFGCARVPSLSGENGKVIDAINSFPGARHIVVMARGQMYYFDVIWADGSLAVSEEGLRDNLRAILADAKGQARSKQSLWPLPPHPCNQHQSARKLVHSRSPAKRQTYTYHAQAAKAGVGVLTAEQRPQWGRLRERLQKDEANASSLRVVDSALFVRLRSAIF